MGIPVISNQVNIHPLKVKKETEFQLRPLQP